MAIISNERYAKYYHKLGVVYERPEIKASLEVIFSVFMVLVLIFAAIRPTLTNLAALQKRITDKESINTKADKKIGQLFAAQEQLTEYSSSVGFFDNAVPSKLSYTDILGRIELLARENNLSIESLSVPGTRGFGEGKAVGEWSTRLLKPDNEGMVAVPVDFQVSGRPDQIKNYLIQLESLDRLITIKSVNLIKEVSSTRGSEKIKASGQVNFYILDTKR